MNYDWESWQHFFAHRGSRKTPVDSGYLEPVYVVVDAEQVIVAYSENEDLSDASGGSVDELRKELPHRDLILIPRESLDQQLGACLSVPHLLEQVDLLRKKTEFRYEAHATQSGKKKLNRKVTVPEHLGQLSSPEHFLMSGLSTWWSRILPSAFGIYVFIEDTSRSILVVIRSGRMESFGEPDLSSLSPERRSDLSQVVKYLSEKNMVPIQALSLTSKDWQDWTRSENPWKLCAAAIRSKEAKLVPFRWPVATLVATRAWFGV